MLCLKEVRSIYKGIPSQNLRARKRKRKVRKTEKKARKERKERKKRKKIKRKIERKKI